MHVDERTKLQVLCGGRLSIGKYFRWSLRFRCMDVMAGLTDCVWCQFLVRESAGIPRFEDFTHCRFDSVAAYHAFQENLSRA